MLLSQLVIIILLSGSGATTLVVRKITRRYCHGVKPRLPKIAREVNGLTEVNTVLHNKGQLDGPEFPLLPACQHRDVLLLLVSDAAGGQYKDQLRLLTQLVDLFFPGPTSQGQLKVGAAVSGTDDLDRPATTWLFQPGKFSTSSDVKRAILADLGRPRAKLSDFEQAVRFAYNVTDDLEPNTDTYGASDAAIAVTESEVSDNVSFTEHISKDDLHSFSNTNISAGQDVDLERKQTRPVTVIVVLTTTALEAQSHMSSDSDWFTSDRKLLIVCIRENPGPVPCGAYLDYPCVDVLEDSMLQDHSVGLALCDRCQHGWFGPMPSADTMNNYTGPDYNLALAYRSCYKVAPLDFTESYALKARERCATLGAQLVSIETRLELSFLDLEMRQRCPPQSNCRGNVSSVFIGLKRNSNSLGMRFKWMNGRPLLYSQWVQNYPQGGYIQGCAVWEMRLSGWVDTGCGSLRASSGALCEWTVPTSMEISAISLPGHPGDASVNRAVNRGQFSKCHLQQLRGGPVLVLLPARLSYSSTDCSWHVNNTGSLQIVRLPVRDELLYQCTSEFASAILYSDLCDELRACFNGQDESRELCQAPGGQISDAFTCASSGKSVSAEGRCDLFADCTDASDEMGCEACRFGLCSDGRCVPQTWLTDGQQDCPTLAGPSRPDWENSINAEADCAFLCNRSACVSWSQLADGVIDCLGPEGPLDETLGALEPADCGDSQSSEWAPRCVYHKDRLGELIGCRNMRHLQDCEDFQCPEGYVKCPRAYCLPVHYLFNDQIDCPAGEDESVVIAEPVFIAGYFKCGSFDHVFIHPDRICDGSADCQGGTDELGCHVTCAKGFLCVAGFVIADDYDRSEPLTDISFVDSRTRLIDFSHMNASLVLSEMCDLDLQYLLELRLTNSCLVDLLGPRFCFPRLSKLDLSYNLFRNITVQAPDLWPVFFWSTPLLSINLSYNLHLEFFDTRTLFANYNLEVLDLSHTALSTFPTFTDSSLSLRYLNLSHTRIVRLDAFTFPFIGKPWMLEVLDLRGTEIKEVHQQAFARLRIASYLYSEHFQLCCPQLRGPGIPAHTCLAPSDPLSSCSHLLENKLLRVLVWIMGVASVLGNLSVIGSRLLVRRTLRLPYAQLVTQLGLSDLLMGGYLLIIAAKSARLGGEYVLHDEAWRHSRLCQTAGFLSTLSSEASSVFILLITLDRYLVIKYPFGEHRLSPRGILVCSALAWTLGAVLAVVPLLPWTDHWHIYSSNAVCLGLPLLAERRPGWQFSTAVFIALNCLLCLLIAVGQIAIYNVVSATRRKAPTACTPGRDGELSPRLREDLALARRLAAVAFTDLLCWLPIGVLGFLALGGRALGGEAYAWMAVFVMPVNSALNPVLYSLPVVKANLLKALSRCMAAKKWKTKDRSEVDTTSSRL
ncbi:hypothetical protein EGW08_017620 [Elysia chlorotica]|uniref:G-protein coupled receptors family 1 profile domain-containing protein n=1 Tax=Elysia chlorotica TaxID=188477 RepID=A0A433SZ95_ELYCH|nr:hypothetical protein EGW08_017620 [Elysia chlorotica]